MLYCSVIYSILFFYFIVFLRHPQEKSTRNLSSYETQLYIYLV